MSGYGASPSCGTSSRPSISRPSAALQVRASHAPAPFGSGIVPFRSESARQSPSSSSTTSGARSGDSKMLRRRSPPAATYGWKRAPTTASPAHSSSTAPVAESVPQTLPIPRKPANQMRSPSRRARNDTSVFSTGTSRTSCRPSSATLTSPATGGRRRAARRRSRTRATRPPRPRTRSRGGCRARRRARGRHGQPEAHRAILPRGTPGVVEAQHQLALGEHVDVHQPPAARPQLRRRSGGRAARPRARPRLRREQPPLRRRFARRPRRGSPPTRRARRPA